MKPRVKTHLDSRSATASVYKRRHISLVGSTFRGLRALSLSLYAMSAFRVFGDHDYKNRWAQDVKWSSVPEHLLLQLPEIARSRTPQRFFQLTQHLPLYMWESACLCLVEERIAQIARVALLRQDVVLSRKFARFPTVDTAVKLVAADAMKYFDTADPPVTLHQRVLHFFQPLDNFVHSRLDFHLAGHARSYDLSPHATAYNQKLYMKDHELFVRQGELQAATEVIAGLYEKVQSMEAMGAEVQDARENSATRELALQQTRMEKIQQDAALQVMTLHETIAGLTHANAQQQEIAAALATELGELAAQLEESSRNSSAELAAKVGACSDAAKKKLEHMKRQCDVSNAEGKRLHAQKKVVEGEKAVLEAEFGDLKARLVISETETATLVAARAALEADKAILSSDLAVLQGEFEGLHASKTQEVLDLQKQCRYHRQLSNLSAPSPVSRTTVLPNASKRPTKVLLDIAAASTEQLDYLAYLVQQALLGMGGDATASAAASPSTDPDTPAPFERLVGHIKHLMAADSIVLLCPFRTLAVQMLMTCQFLKNIVHVIRASRPTSSVNYKDEKEIFVRWWHRQCACVFVDRLQTVPVTRADFSSVVGCLSASPSNRNTFELLHGLLDWMIGDHVLVSGKEPPAHADEGVLIHIRTVVRSCLAAKCAIGNVFAMLCYDKCLQTDTAGAEPLSCCCCSMCDVQAEHKAIRFLCKPTPKRE